MGVSASPIYSVMRFTALLHIAILLNIKQLIVLFLKISPNILSAHNLINLVYS